MPCFAPTLKGDSAFSAFAPFAPSPEQLWRIGDRAGANKGRKCAFPLMLNSYEKTPYVLSSLANSEQRPTFCYPFTNFFTSILPAIFTSRKYTPPANPSRLSSRTGPVSLRSTCP